MRETTLVDSKLLSLLSSFSAKEMRRLGEWISSPFHCKVEEADQLYKVLKSKAPAFSPEKLKPESIWKEAFSNENFDEKKLGYLMSELNAQAEKFLGAERLAEQFMVETSHSLDELSERNLDKHYNLLLSKANKEAVLFPFRNGEFFFGQYMLSSVGMRWFGRKKERALDEHLYEATTALDNFYLLEKLRLSCEHINRKNILATPYDPAPMIALKHFVEQDLFLRVPAISAYYQVLLLLMEASADAYQKLMSILRKEVNTFNAEERKELFAYIRNFCISQIKKGEIQYQRELFEIYRNNLEEGLLLENNNLSPWNFKNIVSLALLLEENVWAEKFMEQYASDLSPHFRESALAYNQGNLFYHTGEPQKALRTLNRVEFTDVFYSLDTRRILLKIYFEQKETEAFFSLVSSFRVFLRRNKLISESNRISYQNFVNLAAALFRIPDGDFHSLEKFMISMGKFESITDEDWIDGMVEKRKKK